MVTDRFIEESDEELLIKSLETDAFHKETTVDFFKQDGTLTKVYSLDEEPILFARACKSLRLDLQFVDNMDAKKNIKVMQEGFPLLAEKAKESGFKEIVFNTSNPLLQKFCERNLGFILIEGSELRKAL